MVSALWLAIVVGITLLGLTIISAYLFLFGRERALDDAVNRISNASDINVQTVVASQIALNNSYYKNVLLQSRLSFITALGLAIAGFIFFFVIVKSPIDSPAIGIVGGSLTELLSGINFYIYGRASHQLQAFHLRLDKLQFFCPG